jgi:5-methylcytosine-specific restriction endonuclease McrA
LPVVVPERSNLSRVHTGEIDPDVSRGFHLLAVQAAAIVQDALERDSALAASLNMMFVYLPRECESLPVASRWGQFYEKAWRICRDINKTVSEKGAQYRSEWLQHFERMQVIQPQKNPSLFRVSRRKWSIATRRSVWMKFGQKCIHCGVRLESWQGRHMHLDHLVPLAGSGIDDESNLVPACPDCNLEKGSKRFPEIER